MFFRIESLLSCSIRILSSAMNHVAPNLNFKVKDDWIEPGLCRQTERCNKIERSTDSGYRPKQSSAIELAQTRHSDLLAALSNG
jgi:hypothetical protein